jgi:predicted Rossmann fold nucleotide-binding protein DprA/Smf involved in DNA uptake
VKLAIIGSRKYPGEAQVRAFVRSLPQDTTIISGGAVGVDTWAVNEAELLGLDTFVIRPDYEAYGRGAPIVRNRQIIRAADRVVAFWDGQSNGTAYTINAARRLGRPVDVFTTSGLPYDRGHGTGEED